MKVFVSMSHEFYNLLSNVRVENDPSKMYDTFGGDVAFITSHMGLRNAMVILPSIYMLCFRLPAVSRALEITKTGLKFYRAEQRVLLVICLYN